MYSRERVLKALRHEEPDRVPIDLDGMAASGIAAIAYNRLKAFLDLEGHPTPIWDPLQLVAIPHESVLERLHVDTEPIRLPILGLDLDKATWEPWTLPDGSPGYLPAGFTPVQEANGDWVIRDREGHVTDRLPRDGFYFDQVRYPLAGATSVAEIERFSIPDFTDRELAWMGRQAKERYEKSDRALLCRFRGSIVEKSGSLRGWEQYMFDLAANPSLVHALHQRLTDHYLANLPPFLDAVGDYADIIVLGDDLGDQNRTLMSPKMYREMVKPYHRQIMSAVREASDLYIFMHSDGNIRALIPDLIEMGVDILNPVQISARDMDPAELKAEFGNDLVFWGGGADTQRVLPSATPEEVRRHVGELVEIFAPGGGYVFTQIHNIQANVPPENIVAMFDAAAEFGQY